ncbi:MAG: glycosyltransferase family 4 protein [Thermoleophilia bacterium]|nr:glycosyltransferase family 4 protein [Thermoleophilia bacterium]
MKILLWHGYLLGGTGSNIYTRSLARAWSRLGHDVVVFCQDPHPERHDLGGATVVRPEIGGVLPVFVVDRYEDLEARRVQDLSPAERQRFVDANAAALREHLPAGLVFTNHLLLGGPVGAAAGVPYQVKAHGSELEFSLRGNEELCAWTRATLAPATAIYAGTEHVRRVIEDVLGPGPHLERVRIVPPGVDVDDFRPRPRAEALAGLLAEAAADPPNPPAAHDQRRPDEGNAARLEAFLAGDGPTIVFVGRISREKGAHVLVDALRRLRAPARTVMAGWGDIRDELEREAAGLPVLFTGALEHRHLVHLFALADVAVTPSTFPEAFGMVAAEAAACGAPPVVARHTGLAEIAEGLEAEYPAHLRELTSFESGGAAELARALDAILALGPGDRAALREAARRAAVARWSWEHVAALILSAGWETPSA